MQDGEPVDVDQRTVHHFFSRAEADPTDGRIRTVATFRGGLDRRQVHVVAIAVAEKEGLVRSGVA